MADKKKTLKKFPAGPKKKPGFPGTNEALKAPEAIDPNKAALPGKPPKDAELETGTPSGIKKPKEGDDNEAVTAELELNEEIDANFQMAWDAERELIEEQKEDIAFKAGNQWSDDDKLKLKNQARPCLTFNKIKAIIKLLTGHSIQNSARLQVSPQGGEDQKFSDVADRGLQHVDEHAQIEFNLGYQFSGGQTSGRSYIELYLNYEKDPVFGHLKSIYHGKPGTIIMDPRGNSYDLNDDRQFGFKLIKKTKSELKDLYPDKAGEIDEIGQDTENPTIGPSKEGDANNYGQDARSTTIGINKTPMGDPKQKANVGQWHVKEYWRFKRVKKWYVYFVSDGSMPEYDSKEAAEADIVERKAAFESSGGLPDQWETVIRERMKKEMHVAVRCGGKVLEDGLSPFEPHYSGFPFFQYIADWTPEAEKLVDGIQGIVRCLKDPQREKNKARSQFLHIINTAANSGWIIDEDALTSQQQEDLKNFGSTAGIVIKKKKGSVMDRIEPTPAPLAQQVREKSANDDFTEVSGINTDLLAMDESANPSGKAIALRIRQGLTILEPDFRNFRYTKKLIGTAIVQMFPTLFDVPKLKKILGENYMAANQIDEPFLKRFLIEIEDLRYNVAIAEQGDTKTSREETFEDLMQMLQHGTQIPFDVLADFMTMPNKKEVIQKVQAYQQQQMAAMAAPKGAPGVPAA